MAALPTPVRNALAYAVPELFWGLAWGSTLEGPLVAAFSTSFGGSESYVGTVSLLTATGLGLPMFFSAYWAESLRHKRSFVVWGHVAGGLVFLAVAALLWLAGPDSPNLVRLAYAAGLTLFFISVGFLAPAWLALVGELFPPRHQARVMGTTFVANRIGALAGGALAFRTLDAPWSPLDQWTLLFVVAGIAGLLGSLPFLWVVEPTRPRPPRPRLRHYVRKLGRTLVELPGLRRFIAADLLGVTTMVTFFFYARAAIERDGFHEAMAGRWVMVGALAQMAMSGLIAWQGARVRPRIWLATSLAAAAVGAASAAAGGGQAAYSLTAAALGVWMAGRISCHAPQVMRLAPGRDGTAPIGLATGLAMPVSGLAPFLAGPLIPAVGYAPVFWVVGGLGAISGLLLLSWVPEGSGQPTPHAAPPSAPD